MLEDQKVNMNCKINFLDNIKWILTRYSTGLYSEIGFKVVIAKDFLKMQSRLVLKVLTEQSIQHEQIFPFKNEGSTSATEQNNALISPCSWTLIGDPTPWSWSCLLHSAEKVTSHSKTPYL